MFFQGYSTASTDEMFELHCRRGAVLVSQMLCAQGEGTRAGIFNSQGLRGSYTAVVTHTSRVGRPCARGE